jgi:hypothetical protein
MVEEQAKTSEIKHNSETGICQTSGACKFGMVPK